MWMRHAMEQRPEGSVILVTSLLFSYERSPAGRHLRRGLYPGATMVIVKPRPRRKTHSDPESKHDFSKDQESCARCSMRRSVWEDTHVPCPAEPYVISTNGPLSRRAY